ncbi:hypothetical protein [Sulfuriferula multivorans]|uniref:hypothetical protein n=1 Tax=Sulfuriferula multivorans TaxID=1559896 RepID=UPI000F5BACC3|nr:hypothetical protein [Sulfuriferula multivorans]
MTSPSCWFDEIDNFHHGTFDAVRGYFAAPVGRGSPFHSLGIIVFSRIKRWYDGESKLHVFENDPASLIAIMPLPYTKYHWSAKIARAIVGFYLRHWQWVWSTIIAILGLYIAVLALK